MSSTVNLYSDITPRTTAYVVKELLERAMPHLVFEKFGQAKPLPQNNTQSMKFRRYFLKSGDLADYNPYLMVDVDAAGNTLPSSLELSEGVTPTGSTLDSEDVTVTLKQYGNKITITDVIMDTHEDPILKEATGIIGEQAALTLERVRFEKLLTCSNVQYANSGARDALNTSISLNLQRKIVRTLKRNMARPITSVVRSTPSFGTQSIAPAYIAVCHPDLEPNIRALSGFVPAEQYGTLSPFETEIGKVEEVRYLTTPVARSWRGAGAAVSTSGMISTDGDTDVYPILYFGRDAYAITPLKGKSSITPMITNPKPSDSDPLAQRGHVGWKAWHGCVILNDFWMARAEVCASALA